MYRGLSCLLAGALALACGSAQAEVKIGFANPLSGDYALTGGRNRIAVEIKSFITGSPVRELELSRGPICALPNAHCAKRTRSATLPAARWPRLGMPNSLAGTAVSLCTAFSRVSA